jgi:citrate synthase
MSKEIKAALSTYDEDSVSVRGVDLETEIMGELDFGGGLFLVLTGREPTDGESRVMNAMLVALMEHGMTPHAIVTRLTLYSAPDATQGAISSGLLGAGNRFLGSMQNCSEMLQSAASEEEGPNTAAEVVENHLERGETIPGLGHPSHRPEDPRAERLLAIATDEDVNGDHAALLRGIQDEFEAVKGVYLPINVTGAIAAVTADLGFNPSTARGIGMISRAGGLVGQVAQEQREPAAPAIMELLEENIKEI